MLLVKIRGKIWNDFIITGHFLLHWNKCFGSFGLRFLMGVHFRKQPVVNFSQKQWDLERFPPQKFFIHWGQKNINVSMQNIKPQPKVSLNGVQSLQPQTNYMFLYDMQLMFIVRSGSHIKLLHRFTYVIRYIIIWWILYTVSAHFHNDIFPENNNLLSTVLNSTRITRKHSWRHSLSQLLS